MPAPTTVPVIGGQFKLSDLQQEGLPFLNAWKAQIEGQLNAVSGAAGPAKLPAGVDVAGSTVTGIRAPSSPTDAVSSQHAEANYSAAALAPQLESGSKAALKSYRVLNSKQQRESYSSFLNSVMNTAPTTNTSQISATGVSGGSIVITVTAGSHLFVDGADNSYVQRSDTIAVPSLHPLDVYYYYLVEGSQTLALSGPFLSDAQVNRVGINIDSQVLIAVAAINSAGLVLNQSAAGATSPATTGNFRLLTRL